jgi:ABC-type transporter Mla subunit MlaD
MRATLVVFALLALFISGCEEGTGQKAVTEPAQSAGTISSQAVQAAAQADETLKTVAVEAEKASTEVNKRLPSIIDSIKKILGIVEKEAKIVQQELDKLPKEPTPHPAPTK